MRALFFTVYRFMSSVFPCSWLLLHQFVTYPARYRTAGVAVTLCGGGSDAARGGRQAVRAATAVGSAGRVPRRGRRAADPGRGAERGGEVHAAPGRRRGDHGVAGPGERAAAHRV